MGNTIGLYKDNTPGLAEKKKEFGKGLYKGVLDLNKLKQNNAYHVKVFFIISWVLMAAIIAILGTSLFDKYLELNIFEGDKKEKTTTTVLAALIGIFMLITFGFTVWFYHWRLDMIKAEDDFVTKTNIISTQGVANQQFKSVFSKYIGERFGINVPNAAHELGKVLATGDDYGNHVAYGDFGRRGAKDGGTIGYKTSYHSILAEANHQLNKPSHEQDFRRAREQIRQALGENSSQYTTYEKEQLRALNKRIFGPAVRAPARAVADSTLGAGSVYADSTLGAPAEGLTREDADIIRGTPVPAGASSVAPGSGSDGVSDGVSDDSMLGPLRTASDDAVSTYDGAGGSAGGAGSDDGFGGVSDDGTAASAGFGRTKLSKKKVRKTKQK